MIWFGFFRLSAPMCVGMAGDTVCLNKPHHIVTLWFSEVVKDHVNCIKQIIESYCLPYDDMSSITFRGLYFFYFWEGAEYIRERLLSLLLFGTFLLFLVQFLRYCIRERTLLECVPLIERIRYIQFGLFPLPSQKNHVTTEYSVIVFTKRPQLLRWPIFLGWRTVL